MAENQNLAGVTAELTDEQKRAAGICLFPGCLRPVAARLSGAGRPSAYCDDPTHTAQTAFRARRGGVVPSAVAEQPAGQVREVATARLTAAQAAARVEELLTGFGAQLVDQVGLLAEAARTESDPEAAAADIETAETLAAEQVAASERRAADERRARLKAEQAARADQAAAEEMADQIDQLTAERDEALAMAAQRAEQLAEQSGLLTQLQAERDEQVTRAVDLAAELEAATGRAEAADQHAAEQARLAEARDAALTEQAEHLAAVVGERDDARRQVDRLGRDLAQVQAAAAEQAARVEVAERTQVRAETERDAAETRLTEAKAENEQRLAELRADRDRAQAEAIAARTEATAAHTRAAELGRQLADLATRIATPPTTKGK